jgi:hypothetical protein
MNTALPTRSDYHRLTHARELRRRAARLTLCERACFVLTVLGHSALALLGIQVLINPYAVPHAPQLMFLWWSTLGDFAFPIGLLGLLCFLSCFGKVGDWLTERLRGGIESLCSEADRLEAEHRARYGELPTGGGVSR